MIIHRSCQWCGSTRLGIHAPYCIIESQEYGDIWQGEVLDHIKAEAKAHYDTMFDCDHGFVEDALISGAAER